MHEQYSEAELEINRMQVNEEEDPEYIANVLQYIANARNSQQGNQSTETTSSQS